MIFKDKKLIERLSDGQASSGGTAEGAEVEAANDALVRAKASS